MQSMPANELPDHLPPFDIPTALSRINDNAQLLFKLLVMFVDTYASTVPTVRRQMSEGRFDDAARLVHSLKGTANILAAPELAAAASAVEQAIKGGRLSEVEPLVVALEHLLAPAVSAAGSLGSAPPAEPPVTTTPVSVSDRIAALAELRTFLMTNNIRARTCYTRTRSSLTGYGVDGEVRELGALLENLDFDGALSLLDRIEQGVADDGEAGVDL